MNKFSVLYSVIGHLTSQLWMFRKHSLFKVYWSSTNTNSMRTISTQPMPSVFKYQPPVNRNMTRLDRSFFVTKIPLVVVHFPEPKTISLFSSKFKNEVLKVPRISRVVKLDKVDIHEPPLKKANIANDNHIRKGILLKDSISSVDEAHQQLSSEALQFLKDHAGTLQAYEYVMDYDFWKPEEIFRATLPEEFLEEIPSGFTATGHVAHVNLRNEFKPYGELIGQVILDKNSKIETVVDKVDSIATKFRTFQMKVLAGKPDLIVEQKESNCKFKFDFSKVYWNSRLHTEHDRLIRKFKPEQCVGDVFAGVGPFAIPAGKKNVFVLSNDLNPESYKYMQHNIKENKVDSFVKPLNYDGREFIRKSPILLLEWHNENNGIVTIPGGKKYKDLDTGEVKRTLPKSFEIPKYYNHYVMNLPDSALTFLDGFVGLYSNYSEVATVVQSLPKFELPWIHCHCFEKYDHEEVPEPSLEELHLRVHKRVLDTMRTTDKILPFEALQFHLVRKVAPTKPMFCVSFQLPQEIAFA